MSGSESPSDSESDGSRTDTATEPDLWEGDPWEGDPWEGDPWEGGPWEGDGDAFMEAVPEAESPAVVLPPPTSSPADRQARPYVTGAAVQRGVPVLTLGVGLMLMGLGIGFLGLRLRGR